MIITYGNLKLKRLAKDSRRTIISCHVVVGMEQTKIYMETSKGYFLWLKCLTSKVL